MRSILALIILTLMTVQANAKIITVCGPSKGYSHYMTVPNMPPEFKGIIEDSISNGAITLVKHGRKKFDILVRDAAGTKSLKANGAQIIPLKTVADIHMFMAIFNNGIEIYLFKLDGRGNGEVAWTKARMVTPAKNSLYVSMCKAP